MENENKKHFDKTRKKNIKKYALWAGLALLVLILTVMPLLAKNDVEEEGPVASVLSGTVESGSITTAIHGGGNLSAENGQDVTLPASVKITEFLVKNGQEVQEGDAVATVDKVSVMTAIVEVTETMDYLQEQIQSTRDETVSSYVKATAGGRIKQVYAEAGDDVQEVMLENGALAVLSLDGLMAVQIQRNMDISTGDSVCVTLADDTEVTGRVEGNLNGVITITVEDEGYEVGQKVVVTMEDGTKIGTGELYVHNAWKATAFTGTISTVYAKEDKEVSSGSTLFTLTDTEFTAQMEYLANKHREYEELLQDLCVMYETGVLTAPCDGTVSGVDKDSAHLLAAEEGEYQVELLTAETESGEEKGWSIVLLSNVTPVCTADQNCTLPHDSTEHLEGCVQACDKSTACDATKHHSSCIKSCDHAAKAEECDATGSHYYDCIQSCGAADKEDTCKATVYHYANCIESCIISDGTAECPATGTHHADCIKNCDKTEKCPGGKNHYDTCVTHCDESLQCDAMNHKENCPLYGITYTAYAAQVTASGEAIIAKADTATLYTVTVTEKGWTLDKNLVTNLMITDAEIKPSNKVSCNAGDIILVMTGKDANGNVVVSDYVIVYREGQQSSTGGMGGMGDMSSLLAGLSGISGMPGMSGMTGITGSTTTQELFDLEGDVLMTITPRETASMTITVDEQDISQIYLGQPAQVEVEALRDQVFEAEVTEVSAVATNNGGSSKFTVKLEMEMAQDMLDGMSATAKLPLYTKMNVLTIPVEALVEDGARTVVYTGLNKDSGEPSAPVEVTVGVSDGINAEILSGLKQGDTYYYSYYDILELDTGVKSSGFSFG